MTERSRDWPRAADRGSRASRRPGRRDQNESAFAAILDDFLRRVPGARAAALVDREGETVDYAGAGDPYDLRVAAAHLRIVLDQTTGKAELASVKSLLLRAARASFSVHTLPEGYALVVRLCRGAGFRGLSRAVPACTRRLADEAGWHRWPVEWHPVDVLLDWRRAPRAVRGPGPRGGERRELVVEVLGRYRAALPQHERAWRVRLQTGAELTLVREAGGCWYSDEPISW